jgi:hypothetical protein
MIQETLSFDYSRFNGLLSIEDADADMRAKNKLSLALEQLGPIFVKHGVCETFGISLLHKHWSVSRGELPITDVSIDETPREYELRPRQQFAKKFYPSILAAKSESIPLEPLEFSADPHTASAFEQLREKTAFVNEFRDVILRNDLSDVFGLGVPRPTAEGFELVEFTNEGRCSVSRELPEIEARKMAVIETGWMFSGDAAAGCTKSCFAKCNVPGHSPSHSPVHAPGS